MDVKHRSHYGGVIDLTDRNDPRTRIVNLIPVESRVLEIGCGSGTIASFLTRQKDCRLLAVELDPIMAAEAQSLGLEVLQRDIEEPVFMAELAARGPFDVVIFADVLEHLRDPWHLLRQVRGWLDDEGIVLASVPNVAHWTIRFMLLAGRWEYTNGFLMDRTHLRWFTNRSLRALFQESGYQVVQVQVRWAAFPGDRLWRVIFPWREHIYATLAGLWPGLFGYQFVINARPGGQK